MSDGIVGQWVVQNGEYGHHLGHLGPTDSRKAAKGTIRGDLGETNMLNIAHASDSVENAEIEVKRFFRADEIPV